MLLSLLPHVVQLWPNASAFDRLVPYSKSSTSSFTDFWSECLQPSRDVTGSSSRMMVTFSTSRIKSISSYSELVRSFLSAYSLVVSDRMSSDHYGQRILRLLVNMDALCCAVAMPPAVLYCCSAYAV